MIRTRIWLVGMQIAVLFWIEDVHRAASNRFAAWISNRLIAGIRHRAYLGTKEDPTGRMSDEIIGILGILGFVITFTLLLVDALPVIRDDLIAMAWGRP